jgi:predicted house-cleaning NTP pyrophosphatase (Maf/HAM1 superfamily)
MREVRGEHTSILGLPMLPLLAYLRDSGVIPG